MAHTYIVSSDTALGDAVTIVGSVDGIVVTVQASLSAMKELNQLGGNSAVKAYVASIMLAAAIPPTPVAVTQLPVGTFVL